jgi:hypothetical protein
MGTPVQSGRPGRGRVEGIEEAPGQDHEGRKEPRPQFAAAGLTPEEVRATVERQLQIQRYLQERFRPIAFADEDRAREEFEKNYVPERKAAGLPVPAFEEVSEEMRARSERRVFSEEVEKWIKELREKARITVYPDKAPALSARTPVLVSTPVPPTPTPARRRCRLAWWLRDLRP